MDALPVGRKDLTKLLLAAALVGVLAGAVTLVFLTLTHLGAEFIWNTLSTLLGVEPGVRDQFAKTGLLSLIGEENVFMSGQQLGASMNQAAAAAAIWLGQPPTGYVG